MIQPQPIIKHFGHRPRGKFFYLFLAQVLLVALSPYFEKPGLPILMLRLLAAVAFFTGVYAVSEKRAQWVTALALAVPAGVLNAVFAFRPHIQINLPALITTILFLAYTLVTLLRAVLRAETVTLDTIYGALSVYLLIAFLWGTAFMLLETLHPGALAPNASSHPNHPIDWSDCMFYSFVTLTSLGYGDMVPVIPESRSLSILEAVSGIMYVAILIARLVGLYSSTRRLESPQ